MTAVNASETGITVHMPDMPNSLGIINTSVQLKSILLKNDIINASVFLMTPLHRLSAFP